MEFIFFQDFLALDLFFLADIPPPHAAFAGMGFMTPHLKFVVYTGIVPQAKSFNLNWQIYKQRRSLIFTALNPNGAIE